MLNKDKVAIITSGYFPIPAVLGGAVEALDENLIKQNEVENRYQFVVFSCYNSGAYTKSKEYRNTKFEYIKIPMMVQLLDKLIYCFAKNILRKKKSMSYRYIVQRLYYINCVAQKIKDIDYDKIVLENHATLFMTLKKYNNYKKYSGKYYYHLHNVVTNDYQCRNIIANCKKVIGVSNYINSTLQEFLGDDDWNDYCVLRNRIDKNKFDISIDVDEKRTIRQEFSISEEDIVVLFSGRFNAEKGIKELLLAFKQINDKHVKLLVVGGYYFGSGMISPFEREMYDLADDMKEQIKFTGFISYERMPKIYAIADVVVIPSIWDDPAPLTVIETLTSGKALITTDSGGIPEYVDSKSSIVVKRDENIVISLKKAIEKIVSDKDLRYKMERDARQRTENWTIQSFYEDFCDLIAD